MNNPYENIEQYLKGDMSDAELKAFENAMQQDAELREEVELQKDTHRFFRSHRPDFDALNAQLADEFFPVTAPKTTSTSYKKIAVIIILVISIIAAYFYFTNRSTTTQKPPKENILQKETLPQNEEEDISDSIILPIIPNIKIEDSPQQPENNTIKSSQPIADISTTKAFEENEQLEMLIRENIRSTEHNITIVEPISTKILQPKSANYTIFELTGSFDKDFDYTISFYDNSKNAYIEDQPLLIINQQTKNQSIIFHTNLAFSNGLYYYYVFSEDEFEIIYAGKFILK